MLTDTFNLRADRGGFGRDWLPGNSERADRQQGLPIEVIVGNPPWSAGQRSSADDNPNVEYPDLRQRVTETYAARSRATLKNSLYDSYKMAIRWASDRIGERGVIALVTNGSWIDGNVDSGVRACLAEEFSSIWVLNLRGNQRTQGERSRREGGKVFGSGSRAPVSITILVRNPDATHEGCRILYRDIGDYLKREQKLEILREAGSIKGIDDWREITPDRHHDWVGQRDPAFQAFYPLGTKAVKARRADGAVFRLYSRGLATSRDAYIYNFSREACAENARRAVDDYMGAGRLLKRQPSLEVEEAARRHRRNLRWDLNLKNNLKRGRGVTYSAGRIWQTQYRPFVKQHCYVEYVLANSKYQQDRLFPMELRSGADPFTMPPPPTVRTNFAIGIPGVGSTKPFSTLVADRMPDLELVAKGQWFPRYRYERTISPSASRESAPRSPSRSSPSTGCRTSTSSHSANASPGGDTGSPGGIFDGPELFESGLKRVDNITDEALRAFGRHYVSDGITKDAIFEYVYGVLHAPAYRERFANDLSKALPRIPMAPSFDAFAEAGRALMELHLGYEACAEHPLDIEISEGAPADDRQRYRIGKKPMKWADKEKRTALTVNAHVTIGGIPPEAHRYQVNGRTPLEWFIDRYRVKTDRRSGIVNDPKGWFEDPRDLISAFKRIVHVSVETVRIVAKLPDPFPR